MRLRIPVPIWLLVQCCISASPVLAETGVTSTEIRIGQSVALSGPAREIGSRVHDGADAWFRYINRTGGVYGRKINLIAEDDGYEPDRARANTIDLIQNRQVFALFGYVGTPTSLQAIPVFSAAHVPFVAPVTGAAALRQATDEAGRYIFNFRAGYDEEAVTAARFFRHTGVRSLNVLYQHDGFGEAGLRAITTASAAVGITVHHTATVERNSTAVHAAVLALTAPGTRADATYIVTTYKPAAAFISEAMQQQGNAGPYVATSFVGSEALNRELVGLLGHPAAGVMITQVVPQPANPVTPLQIDYQAHMIAAGYAVKTAQGDNTRATVMAAQQSFDYMSLEGYMAARTFVEALRRAGKNPTRESLVTALESLHSYTVGNERAGADTANDFLLHWTPASHNGSRYTRLTMLSQSGLIEE